MATLTLKIDSCGYKALMSLAKRLHDLNSFDKVIFDLNTLDFFKPAGMIFICSMIESCRKRGKELFFSYDQMGSDDARRAGRLTIPSNASTNVSLNTTFK